MEGLSVLPPKDNLGIDEAIMVIARDLLSDPAKESRFRAALKDSGLDGASESVRGLTALNAAYLEAPKLEGSWFISHDALLEQITGGQRLSLGIQADAFYEALGKYSESRINWFEGYLKLP